MSEMDWTDIDEAIEKGKADKRFKVEAETLVSFREKIKKLTKSSEIKDANIDGLEKTLQTRTEEIEGLKKSLDASKEKSESLSSDLAQTQEKLKNITKKLKTKLQQVQEEYKQTLKEMQEEQEAKQALEEGLKERQKQLDHSRRLFQKLTHENVEKNESIKTIQELLKKNEETVEKYEEVIKKTKNKAKTIAQKLRDVSSERNELNTQLESLQETLNEKTTAIEEQAQKFEAEKEELKQNIEALQQQIIDLEQKSEMQVPQQASYGDSQALQEKTEQVQKMQRFMEKMKGELEDVKAENRQLRGQTGLPSQSAQTPTNTQQSSRKPEIAPSPGGSDSSPVKPSAQANRFASFKEPEEQTEQKATNIDEMPLEEINEDDLIIGSPEYNRYQERKKAAAQTKERKPVRPSQIAQQQTEPAPEKPMASSNVQKFKQFAQEKQQTQELGLNAEQSEKQAPEPSPEPEQAGPGEKGGRSMCPKCKSSKVKEVQDKNVVLAYAPTVIYGTKYRCMDCRNEWS